MWSCGTNSHSSVCGLWLNIHLTCWSWITEITLLCTPLDWKVRSKSKAVRGKKETFNKGMADSRLKDIHVLKMQLRVLRFKSSTLMFRSKPTMLLFPAQEFSTQISRETTKQQKWKYSTSSPVHENTCDLTSIYAQDLHSLLSALKSSLKYSSGRNQPNLVFSQSLS